MPEITNHGRCLADLLSIFFSKVDVLFQCDIRLWSNQRRVLFLFPSVDSEPRGDNVRVLLNRFGVPPGQIVESLYTPAEAEHQQNSRLDAPVRIAAQGPDLFQGWSPVPGLCLSGGHEPVQFVLINDDVIHRAKCPNRLGEILHSVDFDIFLVYALVYHHEVLFSRGASNYFGYLPAFFASASQVDRRRV
ncbi:MAG: hypothetical protein ACRDF4_02160 [Rhabdochlamydiaceae bacterium]